MYFTSQENFIFENKVIRGFWLTTWVGQQSMLKTLAIANQVQKSIPNALRSDIQGRFKLSQAQKALETYMKNMSKGKVLLIGNN